jgi:uncharacterized repeat protein (TIGR03803 family)
MRLEKKIFPVAAILGLWLSSAQAGVVFTNLISFGSTNGINPAAGLLQAANGNLYGTTYYGGSNGNPGYGTVFRISPGPVFSNIFSFDNSNGANPAAGLALGTNGNFYGTTEQGGTNGGYGTVFEITPAGALTTLFSFNNTNGAYPEAGLVLGADTNFYGTTSLGGTNGLTNGGYGTVFRISHAGGFSNLFSFASNNGAYPYASLALGTNGNFYGTTTMGGTNGGYGTVFEITPAGALTTLLSFNNTNGANPYAGLKLGADGNFYGTASAGGASNYGAIFVLTPAGASAGVTSFNGSNGASPYGSLIQCADGSFYGTTKFGGATNDGVVFKWSPGGVPVSLISFNYFTNGAYPLAGLAQGTDGDFYGTADEGAASGKGAAFRLSVPITPVFKTATASGGSMSLGWTSVAGQTYQLQFTANLGQTNWTNLGSAALATNGVMSASDSVPPPPSKRFYRVVILP